MILMSWKVYLNWFDDVVIGMGVVVLSVVGIIVVCELNVD